MLNSADSEMCDPLSLGISSGASWRVIGPMNNNVLNQHSNILRPSIDTTVTKEYSTDCDGLLVPSEILDANGQSLTVNSHNNMMEPDTYENDFDGREEANI